ncbi:MAG: hypothetical protein HFJ60_02305 [Clostridia bacterium]|jgi:hypothetical protein|nr:hypothetical protein [Clostridia bacterium]
MKTIGFIGIYDKTDMLLNIAKILTIIGKKVLIIDTTTNQKARYIVPAINPTVSYVTSFEDIDIAVGFNNLEEIKKYIGVNEELPYDFLLIDADKQKEIKEYNLYSAYKNYFVTSFDIYSLKRGIEILNELETTLNLTKILFAREILKEENDYLDYISLGYKIIWDEERIYFPIENGDLSVIAENQRVQKIKFKRLSVQYKDSLGFIVQQILENESESNIRKVIKMIERGV